MFDKQIDAVERIRKQYPRMSQPLFSAAIHGDMSGVQLKAEARKLAGYQSTFEREHRKIPYRYYVRLSKKESEAFQEYCENAGKTKQDIIRGLIQNLTGVKEDV